MNSKITKIKNSDENSKRKKQRQIIKIKPEKKGTENNFILLIYENQLFQLSGTANG